MFNQILSVHFVEFLKEFLIHSHGVGSGRGEALSNADKMIARYFSFHHDDDDSNNGYGIA